MSFISPMCMCIFPPYSPMLRIKAAAIIEPMYIGKVMPVIESSHESTVPMPIAIASW